MVGFGRIYRLQQNRLTASTDVVRCERSDLGWHRRWLCL